MSSQFGGRDELEVGFAGQPASKAADRVFHAAFLPRTMGIAEEGLNTEGFVKPVVLCKLVPVVETDGLAHRLWEFSELAGDGPSGEYRFFIDLTLDHAEAGLSFVENQ